MGDDQGARTAAWAEVHRRLRAELDALTDDVLGRFRSELAGYAALPVEALRSALREHLREAIEVMAEDGRPRVGLLEMAGAAAALRAEQGIPVDDVLRGWRIGATELWRREQGIAAELGVTLADQLAAARAALNGADAALEAAAAGYHAGARRREGSDATQRGRLLRGLMLGTSSSADLELLASGYRLTPDVRYRAVRSRLDGDAQAREAEKALLAAGSVLSGRVDGELLAVVPADAEPVTVAPAGVGGPALLAELPRSFAEAAAALRTAMAFGRDGAATLDGLGVEVAVATRPEIGARLAARFVAPLLAMGATGAEVLTTVDEHLRCGLRVHRTAGALFVHPNTVRHRLRRFELATGARLHDIGDVVAVWWALRHHEVHGPG